MKHVPIPEIEAAAGSITVMEERGQNMFAAIQELEAFAVRGGLDSDEAYRAVKRALKRARARHATAFHGLKNLASIGAGVDAAMDTLLAHIATYEAAANAVASEISDHMDVSALQKDRWFPVIQSRLTVPAGNRLSAWVPQYEQIRDAQEIANAVSAQSDEGPNH